MLILPLVKETFFLLRSSRPIDLEVGTPTVGLEPPRPVLGIEGKESSALSPALAEALILLLTEALLTFATDLFLGIWRYLSLSFLLKELKRGGLLPMLMIFSSSIMFF